MFVKVENSRGAQLFKIHEVHACNGDFSFKSDVWGKTVLCICLKVFNNLKQLFKNLLLTN